MAKDEVKLEDIKEAIDRLKTDIAKKEGEKDAELKYLKSEFKVKDLDAAYKMLNKLNTEYQDKLQERAKLIGRAKQTLQEYGLL